VGEELGPSREDEKVETMLWGEPLGLVGRLIHLGMDIMVPWPVLGAFGSTTLPVIAQSARQEWRMEPLESAGERSAVRTRRRAGKREHRWAVCWL
jgi:hypothetical protein